MFILNRGDSHDVLMFESAEDARRTLRFDLEHWFPLARLYSYGAGTFREYDNGSWFVVDKSNLPIKVISIDRRRPRRPTS